MEEQNKKILLVEDDPNFGTVLKDYLMMNDYDVVHAKNGMEGFEKFKKDDYDLCILDVMMPYKDGFTLAKKIRQENDHVPIIFLTAKSQTHDVVEGFNIGGNDYLKKPFSMEELIVRIHNLIDRTQLQESSRIFKIGAYSFDFPKQSLQFQYSEPVQLTHREAHLLFHLINSKREVLDRSVVLKKLWGDDDFFSARSMDVFITKLRKKLSQDESIQIINVRGFGYKLVY